MGPKRSIRRSYKGSHKGTDHSHLISLPMCSWPDDQDENQICPTAERARRPDDATVPFLPPGMRWRPPRPAWRANCYRAPPGVDVVAHHHGAVPCVWSCSPAAGTPVCDSKSGKIASGCTFVILTSFQPLACWPGSGEPGYGCWGRVAFNAPGPAPGRAVASTWAVAQRLAVAEALKSCQREPARSSADL